MLFRLNHIDFGLSSRELEVLSLYLHGYSCRNVAIQLSISQRTVETHITNIRSKWNCRTNIGLAIEAIRRGYIDEFLSVHKPRLKNAYRFIPLLDSQVQLLQYMVFGLTTIEIARLLSASRRSIQGSVLILKQKLGVRNDFELLAFVLLYRRNILIPIHVEFDSIYNVERHLPMNNRTALTVN